jgi:hypothetical protein
MPPGVLIASTRIASHAQLPRAPLSRLPTQPALVRERAARRHRDHVDQAHFSAEFFKLVAARRATPLSACRPADDPDQVRRIDTSTSSPNGVDSQPFADERTCARYSGQ